MSHLLEFSTVTHVVKNQTEMVIIPVVPSEPEASEQCSSTDSCSGANFNTTIINLAILSS